MERGNRKNTARPDSSRQRATDMVTYSFLRDRGTGSETLKSAEDSISVSVCRALAFGKGDLRAAGPEPLVAVRNQSHKLVLLACVQQLNEIK